MPLAGLPRGSSSPVLFLPLNADLVRRRTKPAGGSIAFVFDYSVWVTGPATRLPVHHDEALDWVRRSVTEFEAIETAFVHSTATRTRK